MTDSTYIHRTPTLRRLLRTAAVPTDLEHHQKWSSGVLLGLAAGNVLGLRGEGAWYDEIPDRYPDDIIAPDPQEKERLMDDDLAQTVELALALLAGGDVVREFALNLVRWRRKNGRGMGRTTRRVIDLLEAGTSPYEAARICYERNPIAPNGGLMRCAPVAVAHQHAPERLIHDSAATCAVTHYAPTCQWSCVILNAVIALLLHDSDPDVPAVLTAAAADGAPDLHAAAAADGIPTDVFARLATGQPPSADAAWLCRDQRLIGHTLLTLQVGLWAAVTPLSFEDALVQVVRAGGDTDTNAAVVGAVLGARYGVTAIPNRWLACIPDLERIDTLASSSRHITRSSGESGLSGEEPLARGTKQNPLKGSESLRSALNVLTIWRERKEQERWRP